MPWRFPFRFPFNFCFPFHNSVYTFHIPCFSPRTIPHALAKGGRVKCAGQYNCQEHCYTLGANWDRQGDPSLLPRLRNNGLGTRLRSSVLGRGGVTAPAALLYRGHVMIPLERTARVECQYSRLPSVVCAQISRLAASSQVRKPEIENSIWNASLEIGTWNGNRHGPP